ncbi:MAG: ESPR domain-containing protein, partial [Neisseriaceae bacterium]|nr:ESPR domain-containing protein [Neisseriaceae bacterium]
MNKQYRVIFNHQRNQFVVVSEDTHAHGKSSCKSTVSSVAGKAALSAVATIATVGAGLFSAPVMADTWKVTSSTDFTNVTKGTTGKSGKYEDNFFRPGEAPKYTGSAGFFDSVGATDARDVVLGIKNRPSWYD